MSNRKAFRITMRTGPLWEPSCYMQIGGLTAATFITLLLVPVFDAICVLDLEIVKWEGRVAAPPVRVLSMADAVQEEIPQ